jgi:hypothetical protein
MTIRTRVSFDRSESRRDRRYPLPTLHLLLTGREYSTANWSLGGFLLTDYDGAALVGEMLVGEMRFESTALVTFKAEIVRVGPEPGQIGARFQELSDATFDFLDRCISRRMFGRSGP